MTRITTLAAALVLGALLCVPARPAAQAGAEVALRAAMETETVKGDLKVAIEQYRALAKSPDRAIAAQALVRMAGCHHKLGDAQAKAIYEQVVRDFADQAEAVTLARAYLRGGNGGRSVRGDRAVWTGPEVDMFGRVSPDGTFITYVDWEGGGNLMLRDLATGTKRPLTTYDASKPYSEFAEYSTISPDGKEVAYVWGRNPEQRREIRRIVLNGTRIPEPRRIYAAGDDVRFISPYDWSADGKWIAVAVSRKDGTGQIGLVAVAEGSFRVLKTVSWKGPERIFFSRDSRHIAYDLPASETSSQRDLFVMAIDDAREVPAVVHTANDALAGWSPDGRQLLFSSDRTGSTGLWGQRFVDGKPVGSAELLKADIGGTLSLGLTGAGTLYVYKNISSRDVKVARIDLKAGTLLEPPRGFAQGFVDGPKVPDWSPDGKFLAYQACGGDCVAIRSVETGETRRLQRGLLFTRDPRWSPDSRTLIAAARDRQGKNGIFRIDAQTGEFTNIVYGPGFSASPQWSRDGTKIYYVHNGVVERDLTTGVDRVVMPPLLGKGQLAISPDGQFLALVGVDYDRDADRRLQIVPSRGGEPRELLQLGDGETWGPARTALWTPDSGALIVMKKAQAGHQLWRVPIDGASPRKLDIDADMFTRDGQGLDQGFSLSPDGRQIAFLSGKSAAEVWALENFLPPTTAVKR